MCVLRGWARSSWAGLDENARNDQAKGVDHLGPCRLSGFEQNVTLGDAFEQLRAVFYRFWRVFGEIGPVCFRR